MASSYKGVTTAYETFGTTSAVTGSAPTLSTDGLSAEMVEAVRVVVDTASGQTLSGAGSLDCYAYDEEVALWSRCPGGDLSLVGIPATQRSIAFPADVLPVQRGRVKWVPTGVTFAGGGSGGVTVYMIGYSPIARGSYR